MDECSRIDDQESGKNCGLGRRRVGNSLVRSSSVRVPFVLRTNLFTWSRDEEFATDIKELFPEKQVTLVHSRDRLMPLYPAKMHEVGEFVSLLSLRRPVAEIQ